MSDTSSIRTLPPKLIALCLAGLLLPQTLLAQQEAQQPNPSQPQQSSPAPATQPDVPNPRDLLAPPLLPPDPPASGMETLPSTTASQNALPSAPTPQAQQPPQQPPAPHNEPLGTAAAPAETPTGVAASRPSGAAIAPAKQRRVRAFVISIGLVLAAGAAIGISAGLSKASHSTPQ